MEIDRLKQAAAMNRDIAAQALAERDALAAQAVQMREALQQIRQRCVRQLAEPPDFGNDQNCIFDCITSAEAALALTPTAAEEQVQEWREKAGLLEAMVDYANVTFDYWDKDKDAKVGKRLAFMAGFEPQYESGPLADYFRKRLDALRAAKEAGDEPR